MLEPSSFQGHVESGRLREPIAIVGMSCRLPPDLDTPCKFWDFLLKGRDAVGELPAWRWEPYENASPRVSAALRKATRRGAFLSDIQGFDAEFFGVSAREAACLDPQQRLMLELAWEALEDAGIPPDTLRRRNVGVYAAANSFDYGHRMLSDLASVEPWSLNGGFLFAIANRISYVLDLRGPSLAVDTACAGSLTALHLACQALWSAEIPLAIVGGVNVMSFPGMVMSLDAAGATARDGRSKSFDRKADGYGRGEGAGLMVLARLSDAIRDDRRVLAIVRGTGVFQDGRTAGMMAPNGQAQEAMLRQIYENAGIAPSSVAYVEAHGTGTRLGDRAEVGALGNVFGAGRAASAPCLIGSVKPNVGHLEAGAGMAGLIKAVLCLRHGVIPPSLHEELDPEIDWTGLGLRVVAAPTPWPAEAGPRRAGVSCYGVGGTIAHALIEETPPSDTSVSDAPNTQRSIPPWVFPLSARSQAGLVAMAGRLSDWVEAHPEADLQAIGGTLAHRRAHLPHRAAVVAASRAELLVGLRQWVAGTPGAQCVTGAPPWRTEDARHGQAGVVWVFSGHGAQWVGMGRELLEHDQVFASTLDALAPVFVEELGFSPREALLDDAWSTVRVQSMTFAVQVALAAAWKSRGLSPAAVIGYSVGEIAAAVVSGALEMRSAARFACRRAAAYQRIAGRGAMALVNLSFDVARERLSRSRWTGLEAAISASPTSTVVSGDAAAVDELAAEWASSTVVVRRVATDVAFHSHHIEDVVEQIRASGRHLAIQRPTVRLYNTTLADPRSEAPRSADFWVTNARERVRFTEAVEAAVADGYHLFLEVSTKPIVGASVRETADFHKWEHVIACATLREGRPERSCMATSLATLHCHGAVIDWVAQHGHPRPLDLPTMAWNRKPYWTQSAPVAPAQGGIGHDPGSHTLLGGREHVCAAPALSIWRTLLSFETRPYPGTHPIFGVEIVPAAALLHTFMATGDEPGRWLALRDVSLRVPVALSPAREIQIVRQDAMVRLSSRQLDDARGGPEALDSGWVTHTTAIVEPAVVAKGRVDLARARRRCDTAWSWERIETLYRQRGIGDYGFPWRLNELHRGPGEIVARMFSDTTADAAPSWALVLDGALTVTPLLLPDDTVLRMPSRIARVAVRGEPPAEFVVHAVVQTKDVGQADGECHLDVEVLDPDGEILAEIGGLVFGVLDNQDSLDAAPARTVHVEAWRALAAPPRRARPRPELVFTDTSAPWMARIVEALTRAGYACRSVASLAELTSSRPTVVVVPASEPLPDESPARQAERNAWQLIDAMQTLVRTSRDDAPTRICCVTQGVRVAKSSSALGQAPLWGLARIFAGERPDLWSGLLDVDAAHAAEHDIVSAFDAACDGADEDVISVGAQGAEVLRLVPGVRGAAGTAVGSLTCHAGASYLVTGGLGALGMEAARALAERGARRLVLTSRRGLPPRASWPLLEDPALRQTVREIEELEEQGVTVLPLALDVSDPEALAAALSPARLGWPPIRGVVHAAGVFQGARVGAIEREELRRVMTPKADGLMALHAVFPPGSLDFLVLFSSSGQLGRLSGQCSYAAANSFLDGYARWRAENGGRDTLSIGWMAWRGLGMSRAIDASLLEAEAAGMGALAVPTAHAAWPLAERVGAPVVAVFTPSPVPVGAPRLPLLSELTAAPAAADTQGQCPWEHLTGDELTEFLTQDLRAQVAEELGCDAQDVEVRRSLVELGMDSLMTVSLRVRLRNRYHFELPPTLVWNHPTVAAMAQFVRQRFEARRMATEESARQGNDAAKIGDLEGS